MPTWAQFEAEAPEVAALASRLWPGALALARGASAPPGVDVFAVAYLATVRRDGVLVDLVVERGQAGLVLAPQAGEQLVPPRDETGVLLLDLHRLLHCQPDEAHRQAGQGLGELARLVEHSGGQPGGGADNFGDLTSHVHSVPHNHSRDTRCGQIHPRGAVSGPTPPGRGIRPRADIPSGHG